MQYNSKFNVGDSIVAFDPYDLHLAEFKVARVLIEQKEGREAEVSYHGYGEDGSEVFKSYAEKNCFATREEFIRRITNQPNNK